MRYLVFALMFVISTSFTPDPSLQLGLVKYSGGDWYSNPTALRNLSFFCNRYLGTNLDPDYATVEIGSADIFNHPFLHMTGHGNVLLSDQEAENLRTYLISGGFLHVDDNYGMNPYIRVAMKKVFPELEFIELPFQHELYRDQSFNFENGLPKIHKHDDKPAQGFALIWEGRIVCFYSYESDLGDGWEDASVHKDPEEKRIQALQMGANLIEYAFSM